MNSAATVPTVLGEATLGELEPGLRGRFDVMRAVDFARSENVRVAVPGCGHSLPGLSTCDDGVPRSSRSRRGWRHTNQEEVRHGDHRQPL